MAAKKNSKKKPKKQAKKARKAVVKKNSRKKAVTRASTTRKKTAARRKADTRKPKAKGKRPAARETKSARRTMSNDVYETRYPDSQDGRTFSAGQSGSLQGLSKRQLADSESVDELLEEGNSYEAGIISGVERADDSDEREVTTHEVPEDDVPEEYRDEE